MNPEHYIFKKKYSILNSVKLVGEQEVAFKCEFYSYQLNT